MHSAAVREEVLALVAAGLTDSEIARRTGVARTTVRDMRAPRYERLMAGTCPRCWRAERGVIMSSADYAQLLGFYLGDGHISQYARAQRLRISLDAKHPGIVAAWRALLERCFCLQSVGVVAADGGATQVVNVYHSHLTCLFPQHGAGKKHEREVTLEPWQWDQVQRAPWALLRGLLWSDGCSFINRTGRYEYLSFDFANRSSDIRRLFTDVCDVAGVTYRVNGERVRVYRRRAVALLEANVGVKA